MLILFQGLDNESPTNNSNLYFCQSTISEDFRNRVYWGDFLISPKCIISCHEWRAKHIKSPLRLYVAAYMCSKVLTGEIK